MLNVSLSAQAWIEGSSPEPKEPIWSVNNLPNNGIEIFFQLPGFYIIDMPNNKHSLKFPGSASILEEGNPELPQIARSIIIPEISKMKIEISSSKYIDYEQIDILPSKGNLYRNILPSSVPYTYSDVYEKDEFYPKEIAFLRDPYISGLVRGQAVAIQPFQYNPIKKTLRVFTEIKLKVKEDGISSVNPLVRYPENNIIPRSQHLIYEEHFLNYSNSARYDPLGELGKMLVICHGPFMDAMEPLVDWKNIKGIPTEIVDVNDIGNTSDQIKDFVENYYYQEGLTFLLLVGDIDQIPSPRFSLGNGSNSPADPSYGFLAGDDFYPEIFVGRFSAEDTSHVNTMVSRTIHYERYPDATSGNWFKKGSGFASNQGPGDDGEYDDDHLDIIRGKLLDYNYIEVDQIYDPTGTVSQGESAINEGRSIINYTGHGSNSGWGNGCPMNNTDVNSLVNTDGKWPFIWTVACVTGEFHVGTCFAETWLRANHDGQPTGALAKFASTVNAAWNPPMDAQDEMNDIFVESYQNNIKRSFGGLSINGCMKMNDNYGTAGYHETLYWSIFGDPSVIVRSDIPQELNVAYDEVLIIGATEYNINTGLANSHAAISRSGDLLGTAISDASGNALVVFEEPIEVPGELQLVVTAYNSIPFEASINAIAPEGPYVLLEEFNIYSNTGSGENDNLNFGDIGYMMINVNNSGNENANGLILNLYNPDGLVSLDVHSFELDSLLSGQDSLVGPFQFQVGFNIEDQQEINFILDVTSGGQSWEYEIDILANAPNFDIVSVGFSNLSIDPGDSDSLNIIVENIGHAPLNLPEFSLGTSDPNFTLNDNINTISDGPDWDVANQIIISCLFTAGENILPGYTGLINLNIGSLNNSSYEFFLSIPVTVGLMVEDFENGDFNSFNWIHDGSSPSSSNWYIQNIESFQGNYAARSGEIENSQFTSIKIELNLPYSGELSFRAKTSTQPGDILAFFVNDIQYGPDLMGVSDWTEYSFDISAGEKMFSWVYTKDQSGGMQGDMVMLDWITFPAGAQPHIDYGDLNQDDNVNVLDIILTVASVIGQLDLDEDQILAADMNSDGIVDVFDIMLIVDMAIQQ